MISLYYGSVFPYTGCLFPPATRGVFYSCLCTISCCVSWDVLYWFDPEGSVTMWGWLCIQRHAVLSSLFASSQTHLKLQRTVFKTWSFKPSNGQQLFAGSIARHGATPWFWVIVLLHRASSSSSFACPGRTNTTKRRSI